MATIVNIFGKLYTFLRRPQPGQDRPDENGAVGPLTENTSQKDAVAEKNAVSHQPDSREQSAQSGGAIVTKLEKCLTDSTASSDWVHIPDSVESQSKADGTDKENTAGKCEIEADVNLNGSTHSGTDIDAAYADSLYPGLPQGTNSKDKEHDAGKSPCSVEASASSEVKNLGDKSKQNTVSQNQGSTGKKSKEGKKGKENKDEGSPSLETVLVEKEFKNYVDFVNKNTEHAIQLNTKDLFYKLGYEKGTDQDKVGDAVLGQYEIAKSRNNWGWVREARYYAELFFPVDWIDKNLPHRDQKSNRKNRSGKKKSKHNPNEHFENPSGLCKDYRLKENPDIPTILTNAAGDNPESNNTTGTPATSQVTAASHGDDKIEATDKHESVDEFITDYTEQVIQEAMKMAIGDGLSESVIMEVIDDVTSDRITTPLKRGKLTKLDVSRTPRRRPDQLALGFNYHSDLVVQQSPKTVRGEIIPLDSLPKPRERPEQLAVGFNYLAEQLVKESPKTETGEVLIPGAVTTPRRLARDQLAVGFNYHSDLIAKHFPSKANENVKMSEDKNAKNQKNDAQTLMNGVHNGYSEDLTQNAVNNKKKSAKRSISDTFAVGFSYNSDQMLKESLDEINGNVPNGNIVSSLIEDAVIGEGRNVAEVTDEVQANILPADEIPATRLPAGSVW